MASLSAPPWFLMALIYQSSSLYDTFGLAPIHWKVVPRRRRLVQNISELAHIQKHAYMKATKQIDTHVCERSLEGYQKPSEKYSSVHCRPLISFDENVSSGYRRWKGVELFVVIIKMSVESLLLKHYFCENVWIIYTTYFSTDTPESFNV